MNRVCLIKNTRPMQPLPATKPLESVAADILGPLPKRKLGYVVILVISYRFSKLKEFVLIRRVKS